MTKATLSTTEAAVFLHVPRRAFPKWAAERGVEPLRRQRIGRSTVTVWSIAELAAAAQRRVAA